MAGATPDLRTSLSTLNPGDHLILLYSSMRERRSVVTPFISAGLARGERVLWIEQERMLPRARRWLAAEGKDYLRAEQTGQLVFLAEESACLERGRFKPARIRARLLEAVRSSAREGYPALRIAVTTKWAAGHADANALESFEESLSRSFFRRHDCISLCQYDRLTSPAAFLTDIILSHPLVISGGRLYHNRFPIPARNQKGARRAERELDFLLRTLLEDDTARERLRFLSALVERSSQPIVVADRKRRILLWNPAFLALTGYTHEQMAMLAGDLRLTPPDWREAERKVLRRLARGGRPQRYEKEYLRSDGVRIPVEILRHVSRDPKGAIEYYFSFVTDISARKKAAAELGLAFLALGKSEERFRAVAETATDAIYTVNESGLIVFWNRSAERLFGYTQTEIVGQPAFLLVPMENRAATAAARLRVFANGRLSTGSQAREGNALHRDGSLIPIEVTMSLWHAAGESFITQIVRDIRERRQASEQLRFQAELLAQASDSVIFTNLDGTIRSWNRGAEELYGWTAKEAIGRKTRELLQSDMPEHQRQQFMPMLLDKGAWQGELVANRRDGRIINVFASCSLVRGPDGRPEGTVSVTRDITERVLAEERLRKAGDALRTSEERFRAVAETAIDAIVSFDEEGRISFWNRSAEKMFGYKDQEALGLAERDILVMPEARAIRENITAGSAKLTPLISAGDHLLEGTGIRKSGSTFPIEFSIAHWKAAGKSNLTAIIRDITRRRRRDLLLRDSEERYRSLVDLAPDAIISIDPNFRLTQWNRAAEQLFGYPAKEAIGQSATILLPERLRQSALEDNRQAFDKNTLPFEGSRLTTGLRKDGMELPLEVTVGWHRTGDEVYLTQINRDLSERARAELEINRARAQAIQADKLATIGRLAFSVAHEVNNPLTVMLMSVSFLLEDTPEGDPRRPDLQNIHAEIMRIRTLVKGLLDFSRPSEGRITQVDLKDVLHTSLALVSKSMEVKGINYHLHLPPQTLTTDADRSQLTQVFHNLLVNSMEAMPRGGDISINVAVEGTNVTLQFTDTGSGIAPEHQKSIFEPFFTTKRESGGTGLGLSISRNIIQRFGGTISFSSVVGQGATFVITLPLR